MDEVGTVLVTISMSLLVTLDVSIVLSMFLGPPFFLFLNLLLYPHSNPLDLQYKHCGLSSSHFLFLSLQVTQAPLELTRVPTMETNCDLDDFFIRECSF